MTTMSLQVQSRGIGINIKCIYVSLIYKFVVLLCYITYVTILCYTVNKVVFEFEFEFTYHILFRGALKYIEYIINPIFSTPIDDTFNGCVEYIKSKNGMIKSAIIQ